MHCTLRNLATLTVVILTVHILVVALYSVLLQPKQQQLHRANLTIGADQQILLQLNDGSHQKGNDCDTCTTPLRLQDPTTSGENVFQNIEQMKREAQNDLVMKKYRPWNSTACIKQGRGKPIQYVVKHHLIVSERYKTLFCFVPKVACSNWKRIFHVLGGHFNSTEDISHDTSHESGKLRFLRHYSDAIKVNNMLKTYKKIAFVREPMERFLSAYRSKFAPVDPPRRGFYYNIGLNIIKRMRKNSTGLTPDYPTFKEFANFAISTPVSSHDEHWDRQHNLCAPCDMNYDFVGTYDNIKADADAAIMLMGADKEVTFPNVEAAPEGQGSQTKMKTFYSQISQEEFTRLQNIYAKDYEIFGFKKLSYQEIVSS